MLGNNEESTSSADENSWGLYSSSEGDGYVGGPNQKLPPKRGDGSSSLYGMPKSEKSVEIERAPGATPAPGSHGLFGIAKTGKPVATEKAVDAAPASIPSLFARSPNFEMPPKTQAFAIPPTFANRPTFGNAQPFSGFGKAAENEKKTIDFFGQN